MGNPDRRPIVSASAVEMIAVDALAPYARNSRTHSAAQVQQIAASIQEFGFTNPVLIDHEAGIIAGHGRVLAARRLKMEIVPCIRLSHLSESQRRAYVIADNKIALNAGWDDELLALELGSLKEAGFDLGLTGFSGDELTLLLGDVEAEGLTEDDAAPDPASDRHVSRLGDIWLLGDHRLMCGDSTILDQVEALCAGALMDCCWTDPPYNVAYEAKAGKIANDNMADEEFKSFLFAAFSSASAVMREGAPIYVSHADVEALNFLEAFGSVGFKLSGILVWVKSSLVLGRKDYQWRHEPILYGWKRGAAHKWFGGRAKTTVMQAADMPISVGADGSVLIENGGATIRISGESLHVEELVSSVIRAEKPRRSAVHPTMKPVGLVLGMLKNSSQRGDLVLDLFGGSGTTLIACEKIGRQARLMEFDPRFADVIVKRWQEFSGREASLEGGLSFSAVKAERAR